MAMDPSPASIFAADRDTGLEASIFPGEREDVQHARSGGCLWLWLLGFMHPSILLAALAPRARSSVGRLGVWESSS